MTTSFITYLENKLLLDSLSPDSYEAISDCLHAVKLGEKALETHFDMWLSVGSEAREEDEDYVEELVDIAHEWFRIRTQEYDSYQEVDDLTKRLMEIVK